MRLEYSLHPLYTRMGKNVSFPNMWGVQDISIRILSKFNWLPLKFFFHEKVRKIFLQKGEWVPERGDQAWDEHCSQNWAWFVHCNENSWESQLMLIFIDVKKAWFEEVDLERLVCIIISQFRQIIQKSVDEAFYTLNCTFFFANVHVKPTSNRGPGCDPLRVWLQKLRDRHCATVRMLIINPFVFSAMSRHPYFSSKLVIN